MHAQYEQLVKNDVLQYDALLSLYPWLTANGQNVILSPDTDGILCGLLMSHYFNWNIVGFYDGKKLAIKNGVSVSDCIFLDMDIYRNNIRSCGHHMVVYNKNDLPTNWENYSKCINPNIIRGFDALHNFQQKYPFATIHFLLCAVGQQIKLALPKDAIPILLYADGTLNNLFSCPENCTSWFEFLNIKNSKNPGHYIFVKFANIKFADVIRNLGDIFRDFRQIAGGKKRGGDKIKLQYIKDNAFPKQHLKQIENLVRLLAQKTGWDYVPKKWGWANLNVCNFNKEMD